MYNLYNGYYPSYAPSFDKTLSPDSREYWERSFFQRVRALIKVEGLPEAAPGQIGWDYDAYMYQLLAMGYTPIFRSRKYGIVTQPGFPAGYGLQFQPRGMSINTPFFSFERPLEIGRECAVIKLTPDYRGIWDIISKYAAELQQLEIAIRQSAINARFAYAAIAKNDKDKRSLEALFERMQNGQPGIVVNSNLTEPSGLNMAKQETALPIMQFDRDLAKNFILPELYEVRRNIITDFYKELGVDTQPEKKERMIVEEAVTNNAETYNRKQVWKISLDESAKVCNAMYGTDIRFTINEPECSTWNNEEGGTDDDLQPDSKRNES